MNINKKRKLLSTDYFNNRNCRTRRIAIMNNPMFSLYFFPVDNNPFGLLGNGAKELFENMHLNDRNVSNYDIERTKVYTYGPVMHSLRGWFYD